MSVTLTEVQEVFRKANEELLAKLESKPESKDKTLPEKEATLAQDTPGGNPAEEKADMSAPALGGVIDGLDGIRIPMLNIALPVGSALVGGVAGMVIGDVIDIVVPPPLNSAGRQTIDLSAKSLINVGAQAAGAGAVLKWGPGMIGNGPSRFAAGLMALRVILRIPAVVNLINSASGAIAAPLAGVTLGQTRTNQGRSTQGDVLAQAEQVLYGEDQFASAL